MRRLLLLLIVLSLPRPAHADDYVLQVGWDVRADAFYGLFQFGLHTTTSDEVVSLLQWSLWRNRTNDTATLLQLAAVNQSASFYGLLQVGMINSVRRRFHFGMQLGAANFIERYAKMIGLGQLGLYNDVERDLIALFQVGVVNWSPDGFIGTILQAGLYNRINEFKGLFQVAAINDVLDEAYGIQLGVANFARRVNGLQIGLFNAARTLHGVQIGLLNIARYDAILPVTLLLNVGW